MKSNQETDNCDLAARSPSNFDSVLQSTPRRDHDLHLRFGGRIPCGNKYSTTFLTESTNWADIADQHLVRQHEAIARAKKSEHALSQF